MTKTQDYARSPMLQGFAFAIKQARTAKGMTQLDLAAVTGLSPETIRVIEQARAGTTLYRVFHLCEVLGITPQWEVHSETRGV